MVFAGILTLYCIKTVYKTHITSSVVRGCSISRQHTSTSSKPGTSQIAPPCRATVGNLRQVCSYIWLSGHSWPTRESQLRLHAASGWQVWTCAVQISPTCFGVSIYSTFSVTIHLADFFATTHLIQQWKVLSGTCYIHILSNSWPISGQVLLLLVLSPIGISTARICSNFHAMFLTRNIYLITTKLGRFHI